MKQWTNKEGVVRNDRPNYYVCICNTEGDFITEKTEEFYEDRASAIKFAIEVSKRAVMVELRMERFVQDPFYDAPVTFWSERYENGKKIWRQNWR